MTHPNFWMVRDLYSLRIIHVYPTYINLFSPILLFIGFTTGVGAQSPSLSNLDRQGLGLNGTAKSAKPQPSPPAFQPAGCPGGIWWNLVESGGIWWNSEPEAIRSCPMCGKVCSQDAPMCWECSHKQAQDTGSHLMWEPIGGCDWKVALDRSRFNGVNSLIMVTI